MNEIEKQVLEELLYEVLDDAWEKWTDESWASKENIEYFINKLDEKFEVNLKE